MQSIYTIKTPSFEGPLELLLELIEARKLFVNEIALAAVTDDYISYLRSRPVTDLGETTQFVSVASTLILIKSRSLLPGFTLTKEEEEKVVNLEHRLRVYQIVREAAGEMLAAFGKQIMFAGPERSDSLPVFSPDSSLTPESLYGAIATLIAAVPKEERIAEVRVETVMSLDEMIENLHERIETAMKLSFREFSGNGGGSEREQKVFVIVSFLAMLELVRQGLMSAEQDAPFEDIALERKEEEATEEASETDNQSDSNE